MLSPWILSSDNSGSLKIQPWMCVWNNSEFLHFPAVTSKLYVLIDVFCVCVNTDHLFLFLPWDHLTLHSSMFVCLMFVVVVCLPFWLKRTWASILFLRSGYISFSDRLIYAIRLSFHPQVVLVDTVQSVEGSSDVLLCIWAAQWRLSRSCLAFRFCSFHCVLQQLCFLLQANRPYW